MSKIKNGDMPAMPNDTGQVFETFNKGSSWDKASLGLTKREYFAGLAMQGYMACNGSYGVGNVPGDIANRCVEVADALLKELTNES